MMISAKADKMAPDEFDAKDLMPFETPILKVSRYEPLGLKRAPLTSLMRPRTCLGQSQRAHDAETRRSSAMANCQHVPRARRMEELPNARVLTTNLREARNAVMSPRWRLASKSSKRNWKKPAPESLQWSICTRMSSPHGDNHTKYQNRRHRTLPIRPRP